MEKKGKQRKYKTGKVKRKEERDKKMKKGKRCEGQTEERIGEAG